MPRVQRRKSTLLAPSTPVACSRVTRTTPQRIKWLLAAWKGQRSSSRVDRVRWIFLRSRKTLAVRTTKGARRWAWLPWSTSILHTLCCRTVQLTFSCEIHIAQTLPLQELTGFEHDANPAADALLNSTKAQNRRRCSHHLPAMCRCSGSVLSDAASSCTMEKCECPPCAQSHK